MIDFTGQVAVVTGASYDRPLAASRVAAEIIDQACAQP